jgi:DNA polymerase III subunit gamma/tau
MGKALYRKYRPKTLAEVVGEPQVTETLEKALSSGKISHAYLFIGPRGCGKTSVARIFAHEINQFKYELEDSYVDIIEIDAASNTGVDDIRELREKAAIAPAKGKYKIYIIDEVHMLSKSAFNALLKTLEEPPRHVIFIMATTDAYKVPVTITSRSQVYTFKLAEPQTMFNFLKDVCAKEKIKISDDALMLIVKRGGGSFRDSLSLLEQIATLSDQQIEKAQIIDILGLPEDEIISNILSDYVDGMFSEIVNKLQNLLDTNVKPETILEELVNTIISDPKPALLPLLAKLSEIKAPFIEAKLLVALAGDGVSSRYKTSEPERASGVAPVSESRPRSRELSDEAPTEVAPRKDAIEKTSPAPAPAPSPVPTAPVSGNFLEALQNIDAGIYQQITKATVKEDDTTIHIYPKNKTNALILGKHKEPLIQAGNGKKVEIHEPGELKDATANDPTLSKISDIMGGVEEVNNNGGTVPF